MTSSLATRVANAHPVARLLITLTLAVMIVVGLLGMHVLSSSHSALPAEHAATSMAAHEQVSVGPTIEASCADCTAHDDHGIMAMTCVLGLLLLLALFTRPTLQLVSSDNRTFMTQAPLRATAIAPRSPSPQELSISRT
ncbi:DUF6153 family protein (plasmid) [Coraliomargarita sp. W4R53]